MLVRADRPVAIIAGGTDICAQFNEGAEVASLIDISHIESLQTVRVRGEMLQIGSAIQLFKAATHPLIVKTLPGLAAALDLIANVRVRFRATLGGNIMARRTRYEATSLLLAARARLGFRRVDGPLEMSLEDFLCDNRCNELLLEHIAIPAKGWIDFGYDRSLRPTMTLAFGAWRTGESISARAVIATEFRDPIALLINPMRSPPSRVEAEEIARHAFLQLPEDFADIATSNWYLRTAGQALLARRLRSLTNG